jgi:hypothetical protein
MFRILLALMCRAIVTGHGAAGIRYSVRECFGKTRSAAHGFPRGDGQLPPITRAARIVRLSPVTQGVDAVFVMAASQSAFEAVVVAVVALGVVTALVIALRRRDAFARANGRFWIFHGEADTSPHPMPGARFEERHVIDPPVSEGDR